MPRKKIDPVPEPEPQPEPSVLDYLKALLRRETPPAIPEAPKAPEPAPKGRRRAAVPAEPVAPAPKTRARRAVAASVATPPVEEPESEPTGSFPLWGVLALGAALAVQTVLDGSALAGPPSFFFLFLLLLVAVLVVLAVRAGHWSLADPQLAPADAPPDSMKVRAVPLAIGVAASALAFITMGGNLFTPENVALWMMGIVFCVWAFWLPAAGAEPAWWPPRNPEVPRTRKEFWSLALLLLAGLFHFIALTSSGSGFWLALALLTVLWSFAMRPPNWWRRLLAFVRQPAWSLRITRFGLLVFLAFAVSAFFRYFRLDSVPLDMFSDQAEKLYDVMDVLDGQSPIFFIRNTGREPLQFYLIAATAKLFNTGVSFLSMKIGTVTLGFLSLIYVYLFGKEVGGKRVGLLAALFAGMSYWLNVQARVALRFILYPAFVAPVLFHLVRGLRTRNRNDFIWAGVFLGIGLNGYTPIRALPIAIVLAVLLYVLHRHSQGNRKQALLHVGLLALVSFLFFIPLARYAVQNWDSFMFRTMSRVADVEQALPGSPLFIFFQNLGNGLLMFNWNDGKIWPVAVMDRPALDIISAALLFAGAVLLLVRYVRQRHWQDLFLLLSVPVLMLPSILVLAFPNENPAPNRAGGAAIVVFVIVALALDGLLRVLFERLGSRRGRPVVAVLAALLILVSAAQNYVLVFDQYINQYRGLAWNTTEMGQVLESFVEAGVPAEQAWVLAFPHWVDTRLVGISAGQPGRDAAVTPDTLDATLSLSGAKVFLIKYDDEAGLARLREVYPQGIVSYHVAEVPFKDFYIYFVPAGQ
ncbi:MAG: glycosyltransferase family 39 protein [Anaerolineae bacterium]|nr:MAG: glycosyltransferase family 39 protein [Anaerolineae bacterium]